MKLKLKRKYRGAYTIGDFSIDGEFFSNSLEREVRDHNKDGDLNDKGEGKINGKTAIPYGEYDVVLAMSPKFKRELPRLMSVNHFTGILIHRGNLPKHSTGCILLGENTVKGQVLNSTYYELELVRRMREAIKRGEKVTIEIV